jgi:hypothetical protein
MTDLAAILSIIGFAVTCFLFIEARKIQDSFIKKARIPEMVHDLEKVFVELSSNLKKYTENKRAVHENIVKATGLLESIKLKIPKADTEKISEFIKKTSESLDDTPNEDAFWTIYSNLSGIITYLQQVAKDTRLN